MDLLDARFQGFKSLVGAANFKRIQDSTVTVVGLGGVGSWTVEALARSGVGGLKIVDLDEVCVTNINRQLHALTSTVGLSKARVLEARIKEINPNCSVTVFEKFFSPTTADDILGTSTNLLIDAIDSVDNKTALLVECVHRDQRVITVGSGGERLNPLGIQVEDLAFTIHDPLLQIIRKRLRQHHHFPRGERSHFEIPCIYAPLQRGPQTAPESPPACSTETKRTRKSCNEGLGSAVFLTGTLGFAAAAEAVRLLSQDLPAEVFPWKRKRAQALAEEG
jgi:tRNA A37 threonylcarbamoyladenosine dehydratase